MISTQQLPTMNGTLQEAKRLQSMPVSDWATQQKKECEWRRALQELESVLPTRKDLSGVALNDAGEAFQGAPIMAASDKQ